MSVKSDVNFEVLQPVSRSAVGSEQGAEGLSFDEIELPPDDAPLSRRRATRKLNDRLGGILVAIVLLAPIPLGSNRPIFWMGWAVVLGLLTAGYLIAMRRIQPTRPLQARHFKLILAVGLALPAAALIQLLPLGSPPIGDLPAEMQPQRLTLSTMATFTGILRLLSYGLFFFLMLEIATHPGRINAMARAIFIGIIVHATWGLAALTLLGDIAFWGKKEAYLGVATGTFVNRNSYATFLGMGMVIGIAVVMNQARHGVARPRRRMIRFDENSLIGLAGWLGIAVIATALMATQSRMGIAASLAGCMVVYYAMSVKIRGAPWETFIRVMLLAVILTAILLAAFGQGAIERSLFLSEAIDTRADLYAQVAGMIAERPFFGYGLDTFPIAYEIFHDAPVSSGVIWPHAHNTYLALWVEMGVVAGSLPMLALLIATMRLVRSVRRRASAFAMPVAALGILALGSLHSLVDFSLEIQANVFLFLAILALGLGQLRRKAEER